MKWQSSIRPILVSSLWIVGSEFVRNQLLFLGHWERHYASIGLTFSTGPLNGLVWAVWSIVFATTIYILLKKFSAKQALILAWTYGFVMMWLVIGNLSVLPLSLLVFAIPLSAIEVVGAIVLIKRFKTR